MTSEAAQAEGVTDPLVSNQRHMVGSGGARIGVWVWFWGSYSAPGNSATSRIHLLGTKVSLSLDPILEIPEAS